MSPRRRRDDGTRDLELDTQDGGKVARDPLRPVEKLTSQRPTSEVVRRTATHLRYIDADGCAAPGSALFRKGIWRIEYPASKCNMAGGRSDASARPCQGHGYHCTGRTGSDFPHASRDHNPRILLYWVTAP